jgi:hypothetical protein
MSINDVSITSRAINGFMSAGENQIIFNAGNLASGLYLVNLYTRRELITVKLMLMRLIVKQWI